MWIFPPIFLEELPMEGREDALRGTWGCSFGFVQGSEHPKLGTRGLDLPGFSRCFRADIKCC